MKKVIEVVPTMSTGGAEAMVKDYALLMDREKITIKVLVLDHRYSSENERILDENSIETLYLNGILYGDREDLNMLQKIRRSVSRYYYFRKFILQEKPDVIHIHLKLGWYLKLLPLKKMNVKLIYTVHNVIENYFDKKPGLKSKYFEYREANRLIHRYGMTLVALHDEMNQQLCDYFKTKKVVTVNNGIIMERFDPSKYDREAVRKELLVGEDEFLIGHVGRLHPQKNHDLILEVFCEVLKKKPQAKLLLIGKGELKNEIRAKIKAKKIEDRVIMLENRGDIPKLMSAMDVFLFPSRWEGYGNVLLEAQCMGLRCVISDKVPESVCLTDHIVVCKLSDSPQKWSETLLDDSIKGTTKGNLLEHDMKNCILKLEQLYLAK